MKIGIFAGTFDPIHKGHIAFAQLAMTEAQFDKVIIVAEKEPYRKKPVASWDHRQAMIERATEELAEVDHNYAFTAELSHQHTMNNMLVIARKHYGAEHEFWFLVGSDVYEHMHAWKDLSQHHEYGGFVVALRDDHTEEWLKVRQERAHARGLSNNVILVNTAKRHTSSSQIRREAAEDVLNPDLVPEPVAKYITKHNLYK